MKLSEFGPLEITNYQVFLENSKNLFNSRWMTKVEYQEELLDFEIVTLLGQGSFGTVYLVNYKVSERDEYYAMKVIEKRRVVEKKQVANAHTEKNVMQSIIHPLIIHLDFFFQDNGYLYLIMPFIPGGEMFQHLKKFHKFDEVQSQFYTAQVILALEFLHYLNFIHRDLKPENLLIDHTGYLKLTDFGFCKKMTKGRTYTLCGTPEYMAPEILQHKGYGFAADWWAVGILIYELNNGSSPFTSRNATKVFRKVLCNVYKMPSFFSDDLKDIIRNLLQDDTSKRFGNLKNGVNDIKQHKWFRSVNWLAILSRKIQAPYKPTVKKIRSSSTPKAAKVNLDVPKQNKYKDLFESF